MIRLTVMLRRDPRLSLREFQQFLLTELGPLVAGHQTDLGILRYTQTHLLDDAPVRANDELRGEMEQSYDAVNEFWFESLEAVTEALASPRGKQANETLLAAERSQVDLAASPLWFSYEYPQFAQSLDMPVARLNSPIVKGIFTIRQQAGITMIDAQNHWKRSHGPFARRAATSLDMLRYDQIHRVETALEDELRVLRGAEAESYLGYAAMWQYRSIAPPAGPDYERIRGLVIEDERRFIDFSRSMRMLGKEYVFVDHL